MTVEIQTYSCPSGVLSVEVFFYKEFSNVIFCKMSKTFLWGFHLCFWIKTVKIAKTNFTYARPPIFPLNFPAEFSRRIFPLSNVTARQHCWPVSEKLCVSLTNNCICHEHFSILLMPTCRMSWMILGIPH